jgi:hypothetical protein
VFVGQAFLPVRDLPAYALEDSLHGRPKPEDFPFLIFHFSFFIGTFEPVVAVVAQEFISSGYSRAQSQMRNGK